MTISRRRFMQSAGSVAGLGVTGALVATAQNAGESKPAVGGAGRAAPATQPAIAAVAGGGPIMIGSKNAMAAVGPAMEKLRAGMDPLDAVIAGINVVEDDPNDDSVGFGGLPNEDGEVELDSSVMDGRTHKAGAVAALKKIRHPSDIAALVMRRTDHVLIVGEGALRFAKAHGFKEEDLLTEHSRQVWLEWKEQNSDHDAWLPPEGAPKKTQFGWNNRIDGKDFTYGTIHVSCLTAAGDLVGCTSTSGLSFKIAGRVGDSPIIGAGLYVDNEIGAAGSTGRGEANLQNCSSFMIVELMRQGRTPTEACQEILKRVVKHTEKRLRRPNGEPDFQLKFYALRKDGQFGGAAMHAPVEMTVHDGKEARLVQLPSLYGE